MTRKRLLIMLAAAVGAAILAGFAVNAQEDYEWMPEIGIDDPPPGMAGPPPGPGPGPGPDGMGPPPARPGMGPMGQRGDMRKQQIDRIKEEDPARYKRLMRIRELAIEYRNTDDEKRKTEIEAELRPLVDQELKLQHEGNKERIKAIERRLAKMKEVMKEREKNWDKVVNHTVKEITGQNDYLKAWRGGSQGPPGGNPEPGDRQGRPNENRGPGGKQR